MFSPNENETEMDLSTGRHYGLLIRIQAKPEAAGIRSIYDIYWKR